jgi:hypothetical protein
MSFLSRDGLDSPDMDDRRLDEARSYFERRRKALNANIITKAEAVKLFNCAKPLTTKINPYPREHKNPYRYINRAKKVKIIKLVPTECAECHGPLIQTVRHHGGVPRKYCPECSEKRLSNYKSEYQALQRTKHVKNRAALEKVDCKQFGRALRTIFH